MYTHLIWWWVLLKFCRSILHLFFEVGLGDNTCPVKSTEHWRSLGPEGPETHFCLHEFMFKNTYKHSLRIFIEAAFIYALLILWNTFYKCSCNKHAGLYSTIIQTQLISLTLMALYQHRWGQSCVPFRDLIFEDNWKHLGIEGQRIFH